jgi:hypothetical protein
VAGSDLAQLFHCERHVRTFGPNGMPLRACLRRQLERKRVGEGAKAKLQVVHEFCGEGACELGRANLEAAGEAARTCPGCGAALLEVEACEVCHPARALAAKPPASARIWEQGAVPDVAIGPPPATSEFTGYRPNVGHVFTTDAEGTARAMQRKRRFAAEHQHANQVDATLYGEEQDLDAGDPRENEPPAREAPTEEGTMPRGGAHAACKECGSTTRHKASCSKPPRTGGSPPKAALPAATPERQARAAARFARAKPSTEQLRVLPPGLDLAAMAIPALIDLRNAVDETLRARLEQLELDRAAVREVLGADPIARVA